MHHLNMGTLKVCERRLFHDLDEKTSKELFFKLNFKIIKTWIANDARKDREHEKCLNIIVKK